MHRKAGFACGIAKIRCRRFASSNQASILHKQFLLQKRAQNRLGVLGEGEANFPRNIIYNGRNCTVPNKTQTRRVNSAIKKNKKKCNEHSAGGCRRAYCVNFPGPSITNFPIDPCETSRAYQHHLRQFVFPKMQSTINTSTREDLKGLKTCNEPLNPKGARDNSDALDKASPSHLVLVNSLKRAGFAVPSTPSCRGKCPLVDWTMEQYCRYCHG